MSEESQHVENKVESSLSVVLVEYLSSSEPAGTHQFTAVYCSLPQLTAGYRKLLQFALGYRSLRQITAAFCSIQ